MSNIFDAVRKGQGPITDTVLSALYDTPEPAGPPAAEQESAGATTFTALLPELGPLLTGSDRNEDVQAKSSVDGSDLLASMQRSLAQEVEDQHASDPIAAGLIPPEVPAYAAPPDPRERIRTVPLVISSECPLLPFDTDNWHASEQYRMIRTKIIQHTRKLQMVLISSACAGDGKSVTAINIAGALALTADADVLLIDGDFRRSAVHTRLSLPLTPGLVDVLMHHSTLEDALVRAEQFPNFYILPAGRPRDNPSDLLESASWVSLQEQLRKQFRYIIVDCPPIGSVSEYDLLQSAGDGVIVVGRPDHTRLDDFLKALGSVPNNKMVGVVMNRVQDWFLHRPYSSRYDYPRDQK